jgi:hypothetical protein
MKTKPVCKIPALLIMTLASLGALAATGCAPSLQQPLQQAEPAVVAELWREPIDLETRDLLHGSGGAGLLPSSDTYTFVANKTTGTNRGYDVRDHEGRLWSVKLGDEARSEVTTSRVLWAVGYHQPPTFYVSQWRMSGDEAGEQPAARFRAELPGHQVEDEWSWYDNPFIGSRPFGGLIAINLLLNNWDLKTPNNKVYVVRTDDGVSERRYVVRDLGASLGSARQPRVLTWMPFMRKMQGSKSRVDDFEKQEFVKAIDGEKLAFDYQGLDQALVDSVTVEDVRWACALLTRLADTQWRDAFRAGGYSESDSARYVQKVRSKIQSATTLVAG